MKNKKILATFILMAATPLSVGEDPHQGIVNTNTTTDRGREISTRANCGPALGACTDS